MALGRRGRAPVAGEYYTVRLSEQNVDQNCVEREWEIGTPMGRWAPLVNDCQTLVDKILEKCSTTEKKMPPQKKSSFPELPRPSFAGSRPKTKIYLKKQETFGLFLRLTNESPKSGITESI